MTNDTRWYERYDPRDIDEMDLEGIYEEHTEATNMACECRYCTFYAVSNGWQGTFIPPAREPVNDSDEKEVMLPR